LFEPQWGSSQAAFPWPKNLLKRYVDLAKGRNIKVVCDEIMCGLGRHGQGTLFLSEAWDLDPDAVTFGKAIAAGVYPLSGAIVKRGRKLLQGSGRSVMQSHTYAGSSTRALMAATEVLREIPTWLPSVAKLGEEMEHIFRYINKVANGMVVCQGQGLMWGGLVTNAGQNRDAAFRSKVVDAFKESCGKVGVLPYFVPVGGFMVSPVIDIDVGTIYEIGERLEKAVAMTKEAVGWEKQPVDGGRGGDDAITIKQLATQISNSNNMNEKCHPLLHQTRSCTSCSSFVCKKLRTRFVGLNL
jgi:adenosylmethionine-8-amino-7-oxononanoate aminotransferase